MDIKNYLLKKRSGKTVLRLFLATNFVYIMMLAVTIPKVASYADGLKILDMMPTGYDLVYVKQLFDALGTEGRNSYLFCQLPLDMIYPFLFGLNYCLLLAYFLRKLNKFQGLLMYCCWLPVFAAIADYAENMGILNLLLTYPHISKTAVITTNMFTLLKSASSTIYFILLMTVLIWWGLRILFYRTRFR